MLRSQLYLRTTTSTVQVPSVYVSDTMTAAHEGEENSALRHTTTIVAKAVSILKIKSISFVIILLVVKWHADANVWHAAIYE